MRKKIQVGNVKLKWGNTLLEMTDSTHLSPNDTETLHKRLQKDGFLFIRNIIPTSSIEKCQTILTNEILYKLNCAPEHSRHIDIKSPFKIGFTIDAETGIIAEQEKYNNQNVDRLQSYFVNITPQLGVHAYNSQALHDFYSVLWPPPFPSSSHSYSSSIKQEIKNSIDNRLMVVTPSYTMFPGCTWIRLKGSKEATVEHTDYYFFKESSAILQRDLLQIEQQPQQPTSKQKHLCSMCGTEIHKVSPREVHVVRHCSSCANGPLPYYTAWIALSEITPNDGCLAVIPNSHNLQGYDDETPSLLPNEFIQNKSTINYIWMMPKHMNPGDIILFNIKTIHAASRNNSGNFRLSCDTRVRQEINFRMQS